MYSNDVKATSLPYWMMHVGLFAVFLCTFLILAQPCNSEDPVMFTRKNYVAENMKFRTILLSTGRDVADFQKITFIFAIEKSSLVLEFLT